MPIGTDLLFRAQAGSELVIGVEICEDLWGPLPPSSFQVLHGAHLILNLSASNELVGKADYRRSLVAQQSARGICAYVYASCGVGESTQDVVFGGHAMVAEDGAMLAESRRFAREGELLVADVDVEHLRLDRERTTSFGDSLHAFPAMAWRMVDVELPRARRARRCGGRSTRRRSSRATTQERNRRTEEIISIQTSGARQAAVARAASSAWSSACRAASTRRSPCSSPCAPSTRSSLPRTAIVACTMPGFGTSDAHARRTPSGSRGPAA